ncbi:MAG: cytochrome c biogenesis CcdA family protein [Bacillota bacterium]
MLATAFAAGVLSFLSPCIIPMLSVYFTLITGLSFKDLEDGKVPASLRWSVLARTGAFVLAFTLVFTAAGALAGQAGQAFGRAFGGLRYFEWLGGAIVILFGLGLMGWIKVPIDRLLGHLDFDYQRLAGRRRLVDGFGHPPPSRRPQVSARGRLRRRRHHGQLRGGRGHRPLHRHLRLVLAVAPPPAWPRDVTGDSWMRKTGGRHDHRSLSS